MIIREARPDERRRIEELTREAFWNLYVPGANEHYIVHVLWDRPDFIAELSLVAEIDGQVVGSIIYTRSFIEDDAGQRHPVLTFGPVSVLPDRQGEGIGAALIKASIDKARMQKEKAICILGYPGYYERFGFRNARAFGVSMPDDSQPWAFQILQLHPYALDGILGRFHESEAFDADPEAVAAFDAGFPPKDQFETASQKAFALAATLQDGDEVPEFVSEFAQDRGPVSGA